MFLNNIGLNSILIKRAQFCKLKIYKLYKNLKRFVLIYKKI